MAKYLIEVPHEADKSACAEAVRVFQNTGSHFLTNADWGCMDGEHKAWFFMDINDKQQALNVVPPAYRRKAKITFVNKFSIDEMDQLSASHG